MSLGHCVLRLRTAVEGMRAPFDLGSFKLHAVRMGIMICTICLISLLPPHPSLRSSCQAQRSCPK